ncbi:MAG: hypothetical protein MN733_43580 [Nitrososphaera sp.]|nr:hypothetical protein [Nitrososphaera sp.]
MKNARKHKGQLDIKCEFCQLPLNLTISAGVVGGRLMHQASTGSGERPNGRRLDCVNRYRAALSDAIKREQQQLSSQALREAIDSIRADLASLRNVINILLPSPRKGMKVKK